VNEAKKRDTITATTNWNWNWKRKPTPVEAFGVIAVVIGDDRMVDYIG